MTSTLCKTQTLLDDIKEKIPDQSYVELSNMILTFFKQAQDSEARYQTLSMCFDACSDKHKEVLHENKMLLFMLQFNEESNSQTLRLNEKLQQKVSNQRKSLKRLQKLYKNNKDELTVLRLKQ